MQDTCPSNLASGAAAAAVSAPEVQAPLALPALVQRSVQLHRMQADGKAVVLEQPRILASESPVALVFNGVSHAVMMATPQDLEVLALGFALSEGILDHAGDCYGIEVQTVHSSAAEGRQG